MTKEKMIETLYWALGDMTEVPEKVMSSVRENGFNKYIHDRIPEFKVASVIVELENEIAKGNAKKSGKSDKMTAIKSILKSAKKECKGKPIYHNVNYVYHNDIQYQCACDGYRVLLLEDMVSGIPGSSTEGYTADSIESVNNMMTSFIDKSNNYSHSIESADYIELEKRVRTLKTEITSKNNKRVIAIIDDQYVFNAEYLIDGIKAIGNTKIYIDTYNPKAACYMKNDKGDIYVLMPVHTKDMNDTKNTNKYVSIQCGKIV